MNKIKRILLLAIFFTLTVVVSFYFENYYRVFIRQLFNFFQGDKIKFVGKNFHMFASPYLLVSFGLFCVILTILLYRQCKKRRLISFGFTILLFFITTFATTYFDSTGYVIECTACNDGVRNLNYNEINYDYHFITSLVVGLLPLLWTFFKNKISNRQKRSPSNNIVISNCEL